MKIRIAAPAGMSGGNATTASRWARRLEELGHEAALGDGWRGEPCDLLIVLHARRSAAAAAAYRRARPAAPLLVALTGTDLYRDLPASRPARDSLAAATRLVVLQPLALEALPPEARAKARVIVQAAEAPPKAQPAEAARAGFRVCVLAHLRAVKDPLLAAQAARGLPPDSRLEVVHAGGARSQTWARAARAEQARNPRYRWLGELPRAQAATLLANAWLLVLSSRLEGGANVIGEAVVAGVPVAASRIAGSVGLLGGDYPGYFPVGDAAALGELLRRAETDHGYYRALQRACNALRPRFAPERERQAWRALLAELGD